MTDDTILPFSFPAVHAKKVTAAFDGGRLTSNGGVMLLAMAERRLGLAGKLARCSRIGAIRRGSCLCAYRKSSRTYWWCSPPSPTRSLITDQHLPILGQPPAAARDAHNETITFANHAALHTGDFAFV